MDERAHQLVDSIYAAAFEPKLWQEVAEQLSVIFHGSPLVLGRDAEDAVKFDTYAVGIQPDALFELDARLMVETSWDPRQFMAFSRSFGDMASHVPGAEIEKLTVYHEILEPLGLAPIWPAVHSILDREGRPLAVISVFRKQGQGPFSEDELEYANQFVPHFSRAMEIQRVRHDSRSRRGALGEAVDRFPTGVVMLDSQRQVVLRNRAAKAMLAEEDGLLVDGSGPAAQDTKDNARLQTAIAQALEGTGGDSPGRGFVKVGRPSGRREYAVMVSRLAESLAPGSSNAAVVLFIFDPDSPRATRPEVLTNLFELTNSEAEIVRLLSKGMTIEQVAAARGVSINTARSHLKHAFAKTGTGRQTELLQLVLSGVGSLEDALDTNQSNRDPDDLPRAKNA